MFRGSYTALITPFDGDQVDEDALARLIEWQIENGSDGILVVGTTGESPTLSHQEHKRVVEVAVEAVDGRIRLMAGAGSNSTAEAVDFSRHAESAGVDALLHVAGYYNRPGQEGMYRHFEAVHDACELPIIVYNIPTRCVIGLDVETMVRLSRLPRIVGVKDSTQDLTRPGRERIRIDKTFFWFSGEDPTAVAYNASGGNGCISVTANVAPAECAAMQSACRQGDYGTALEYQDRLMPLHEALFAEPSPAGVKYALSRLGLCSEYCRLPMVPLADETRACIDEAMDRVPLTR